MISIDTLADGQVALHVAGRLERDDITKAIAELEAVRAEHGDLNVLIDLTGFSGMTAEALITDLRYGITHLSELKHYNRIAIITDADWISALVWIENRILRQTDMRCFEPDEMDVAKHFIAGEEVPEKAYEPSILRLASNRPDLIVFEVRDKVRTADAHAMFGFLSAAYEIHDKVDLMIIIRDFALPDLSMLFDAETWKAKTGSFSHINKYAVVGGPAYVMSAVQVIGSFLPVDVKTFPLEEMGDAWTWLGARPLLV